MSRLSTATILFVDDDPCMRDVMAMILSEEGYQVSTASDGFEGLVQLRSSPPDLIISDLHMPHMSGIEFLSIVRRRFPAIPVIAISGAYQEGETLAAGVMADAFYPKGRCHPDELMQTIRQVMYEPLKRPTNYHPCYPPRVQTARRIQDGRGNSALHLTCAECLRSFSIAAPVDMGESVSETKCVFCMTPVPYSCSVTMQPAAQVLSNVAQAGMQLG